MRWDSAPCINAFPFPVSVNRPEVLWGKLSKPLTLAHLIYPHIPLLLGQIMYT